MTDLMKWFDTRRSPMDLIERLFEGETGSSAMRRIQLPTGVQQDDVSASYKDGVLEVRAPMPDQGQAPASSKIPITRG